LVCGSSTIAFRAEDIQVATQPSLGLNGRVGYRTDLERLSSWITSPRYRLRGEVVGQVDFSSENSVTKIRGDAEASNIAYEIAPKRAARSGLVPASNPSRWETVWADERLNVAIESTIDASRGDASFDTIKVTSAAASLGATGTLHDFAGRCDLDLVGEVSYDLQKLTERLGRRAGLGVKLTGVSTQPISFRGPLRSGHTNAPSSSQPAASGEPGRPSLWARASAATKLDWKSASIYGFSIGAGVVDAQLANGVVKLEPIKLDVSGGRVSFAPQLDLRQDPILLTIPGGTIAERVQITREMCHAWLKYVAPLVADTTAVEGELSITLNESSVPVSSLLGGKLQGVVELHSGQIGPGALATQYLSLAEQVASILQRRQPRGVARQWVQLPPQRIPFHVENGRVYHQGMHVMVDELRISTTGSVGLDQSLALVASVPIPDDWVAQDRWLSAFRGQTLQVPIGGTLSSPRLDAGAVDQLAKQLIGGAAGRLLEQEIGRGLERLLQPRE
jgi:hypothetical protein